MIRRVKAKGKRKPAKAGPRAAAPRVDGKALAELAQAGHVGAMIATNLDAFGEAAGALSDPQAGQLANSALAAIAMLSLRASTPEARNAAEVATHAVLAMSAPGNAALASSVERMHRALLGADVRGDRAAIYEVETLVRGTMIWACDESTARAATRLRNALARRWADARAVDEERLGEWLEGFGAKRLAMSGVIARILVAMQLQTARGLSVTTVTKRVDDALRERTTRHSGPDTE